MRAHKVVSLLTYMAAFKTDRSFYLEAVFLKTFPWFRSSRLYLLLHFLYVISFRIFRLTNAIDGKKK